MFEIVLTVVWLTPELSGIANTVDSNSPASCPVFFAKQPVVKRKTAIVLHKELPDLLYTDGKRGKVAKLTTRVRTM